MSRKWLIAIPLIAVLLMLCALMLAIVFKTAPRISLTGGPSFNLRLSNFQAEKTDVYSYTVDSPTALTTLIVDNPCGDVSVSGDSEKLILLTAHKKARGLNQKAAEETLAKIQLSVSQDGSTLSVGFQNGEEICGEVLDHSVSVDFTIQTPKTSLVKVESRFGEVSISGVDSSSASEPAKISSDFGTIRVSQTTGGLIANSKNGNLTVREAVGGRQGISLTSTFGNVHLEDSGADQLDVQTENGEVKLANVQIAGDSKLKSSFGNLTWTNGKSQSLTLESKNGAVVLRDLEIEHGVKADNDFGDIRLDGVKAAAMNVTTLNGRIDIRGASGKIVARSDFGGISILEAEEVDLDLTSKNGSILFQGSLGEGPHQATSQFGEIRLQLPPEAAFSFDLQTSFGSIRSDFEATSTSKPSTTHWTGKVKDGGAQITAATQNGNIIIEMK